MGTVFYMTRCINWRFKISIVKPVLKIASFILLAEVLLCISCTKEYSCEGCREINKTPTANAGVDTVIVLPVDSIKLDGSASADPDGTITSFLWTKISGPDSFSIKSTFSEKTIVGNLTAGTYQFELKVTDNGGLSAKDTMRLTVDSVLTTNHPPVANAGADQSIMLPVNSVNLDGSASSDPDNNIASYSWMKISGPSSFNVSNVSTPQTQVKNLVQGVYGFELKVTDAGGLFSKDTVQVIVNASDNTDISCNVSMTAISQLPESGGVSYSIAAGNKILFARYSDNGLIHIYDTSNHTWSSKTQIDVSYPNLFSDKPVTVGSKILFSRADTIHGYQVVNIYDASSNSWSVTHLPEIRENYTRAVVGSKVIYAGGHNNRTISKKLDIYDASTNSWSVQPFNEARANMIAASIGNKVFFAGGFVNRYDSLILVCDDYGNNCHWTPATVAVDTVNILDLSANTWSIARLKEARGAIETAIINDKLIFASGYTTTDNLSSIIDVYNAASNTWSSANLGAMPTYLALLGAYAVGDKVLLSLSFGSVFIYDAISNSSWNTQLTQRTASQQQQKSVATLGSKIVFFTVYDNDSDSKNIDIYDSSANTWCHTQLNSRLVRSGIIGYGNRVYIAGGFTDCCNVNKIDTIWHFSF